MKIALFTDGIFPFQIGGMQKHSYYLMKYFLKKKVEVHLYLPKQQNPTQKVMFEGINNLELLYIYEIEKPVVKKFPGHYIWQEYLYSKNIALQFYKNPSVDFVYAQGFTAWFTSKNKTQSSTPIAVNFHGIEVFQPVADKKSLLQQWLLKPFVKQNLVYAHYVFSLGKGLTQILLKQGIEKSKIIEIPIGIEPTWLNPQIKQNTTITFIFVGRYERRKGIEELNEALQKLIQENYNFHFHFIGPIPNEKKVMHHNIIYHGKITEEQKIKALYTQTEVVVVPSYSEGMPTVLLEAMASGCTALATNVGAVADVVNNQIGFLISNPNANDLYIELKKIINSSASDILKKRKASQSFIKENFMWEYIIQKTLESIKPLVFKN
jgi:glycosyltransferase involved in cell wall biosynthesis